MFQSSPNRGRVSDWDGWRSRSVADRGFSPLQIEEGSATHLSWCSGSHSRIAVSVLSKSRKGQRPRDCSASLLRMMRCFSPLQIEEGSATKGSLQALLRRSFSPLQIEEGSATRVSGRLPLHGPSVSVLSKSRKGQRRGSMFLLVYCSAVVSVLSKSRKGQRLSTAFPRQPNSRFQSSPNRGRVSDRSPPTRNIALQGGVCNAQNCTRARAPRNPRPLVQFRSG